MKIAITGRNFSTTDNYAIELLQKEGIEVADYSNYDYGSSTDEDTIVAAVKDCDGAICGLEPYTRYVIERCPKLKLISRRGIGYDNIDLDACKERGITLLRTAGEVEGAVAEHVMAYILYFAREIGKQSASMHQGKWERMMTSGAKNRTLGLIGFGGIGKEIAKRALPFGMKVIYYTRHNNPVVSKQYGVEYCDLDTLLATSDYVSVNVPLTNSTIGMFDEKMFKKMKKDSVFINISRGQVADEIALVEVLKNNHLKGAGVDVFASEPCTTSPLIECSNALLTPHTAPFTSENFISMNNVSATNIIDYLKGTINENNRVI